MRLHTKEYVIQGYQCTAKKSEVTDLFLCSWTTNGTICSTLGVLFFESWNNPLKAGANDKVGLWMGAAVNLKSWAIVVGEEPFGRGLNNTGYCKNVTIRKGPYYYAQVIYIWDGSAELQLIIKIFTEKKYLNM